MKRLLPILLVATGLAGRLTAEPMTIDGYAAIVNDHVITVGDILEYIMPAEQDLRISFTGSELAKKRAQAYSNGVQRLVEQQLIVEEFKRKGGKIPDRLVNDRVNQIIADRFHNNRAEFLKALADQKITMEEWRNGIHDRLVASMLRRQEIGDKIRVTPGQVLDAYEKQKARFATTAKVKIRKIAFHKGATDDANEARHQELVLLRGRIAGGEDFADTARKNSEDVKASSGGDWGWTELDDLRKEVKDAIASLKPGEMSNVLDTGGDYQIILVEERKEAGVQPFEEVRAQLEDELKEAEGERLFTSWIDRLKRKSSVQIFETSSA